MAKKTRQVKCAEPTLDDAIRTINKWYNDEIRSIAEEANEGVKSGEITDLDDWLHETIDGHEFVIYTHKARLVLVATDHPDAYEDEYGDEQHTVEQAAYAAMMRDVRDHLDE